MLNKLMGVSCLLLILAGPRAVTAAPCTETLVFDQATRTIRPEGATHTLTGVTPTYRSTGTLCLKVINTSTGAFDVSFDTSGKEELGNVTALKTFWTDFKPLQIDLLQSALGPADRTFKFSPRDLGALPAIDTDKTIIPLLEQIACVDDTVERARDLEFRAVQAIAQMAARPEATSHISQSLSDYTEGTPKDAKTLPTCGSTLKELDDLNYRLAKLIEAIHAVRENKAVNTRPAAIALLEAAGERRQQFAKLFLSAQRIRALVERIREAKTSVEGPSLGTSWDEGQLVVVTITPVSLGELGSVGGSGMTFKVKIVPKRGPRFSVGATLLYAPKAIHETYSEVTQEDGSRVVAANGTLDRRLMWAITLSTTWSLLDDRERSGLALYLPELLVAPQDDRLGVGIGTAVGWKMLRLSTGLLWTRHPMLENQKVGTVLESGQALKVRDGYDFSAPSWFLGLGLAL